MEEAKEYNEESSRKNKGAVIRIFGWILLILFVAVAVVTGSISYKWWSQRDKEAMVSQWLIEAEHDMARGNYEESKKILEWIRKYHSYSLQMDKVMFALGTLYMDYFGELKGAAFYFSTQMRDYWFSTLTFDSWKRIKDIERLKDSGTNYEGKVWKEFKSARRSTLAGRRVEGLMKMKNLVDSYPLSNAAPEILYTMGEISLKERGLTSDAKKYFNMLKARYPASLLVQQIPPASVLSKPDMPLENLSGERS